jgi:hypothetical protein
VAQAVEQAPAGSHIHVRPGIYKESLVLKRRVTIEGEGEVVIRAERAPCITMQTREAAVSGMTLLRTGLRRSHWESSVNGAAVRVGQGRLHLQRCEISSDLDDCVAIHGPDADPLLEECCLRDANMSGVRISDGARGTLRHCKITRSTAAGVWIESRGNPVIEDCSIGEGKGSGILLKNFGRATVRHCDIFRNGKAGIDVGGEGGGTGSERTGPCHLLVEDSQIHDRNGDGIAVRDGGNLAFIRRCRLETNEGDGLLVEYGANPVAVECHFGRNGKYDLRTRSRVAIALDRCVFEPVGPDGRRNIRIEDPGRQPNFID